MQPCGDRINKMWISWTSDGKFETGDGRDDRMRWDWHMIDGAGDTLYGGETWPQIEYVGLALQLRDMQHPVNDHFSLHRFLFDIL
jgi:hypothetical protein